MAKKPPKLKVFRTAIGFHDAYVAAPTKKAALEAWGSKKDLFGRGAAEQVTDETLTAAPLAVPGTVIKVSRGTTAEQIAALPPDKPKRAAKAEEAPTPAKKDRKPKAPPKPKPSRAKLEAAEQAITEVEEAQAIDLQNLAEREAELARERRLLAAAQSAAMARLVAAKDAERAAYDDAVRVWRG